MKKLVKFDFFKISIGGNLKFSDVLKKVWASPDDKTRNEARDGDFIRLQDQLQRVGEIYVGEMIRIRMDDIPRKASIDGQLDDIDLDDDEGLGEETGFGYHPSTKILTIQRNNRAVSASVLAWYFSRKCGHHVEIFPLLEKDALIRLSKMPEHKKIEIALAEPKALKEIAGKNDAIDEILNINEYFGGINLNMTVSMGRKAGKLSEVVNFVQTLLGLPKGDKAAVRKLRVFGCDSDETKDFVDLLIDRLIEEVDVKFHSRTLPKEQRLQAVVKAWEKQMTHIKDVYGKP